MDLKLKKEVKILSDLIKFIENIKKKNPIIHCITNNVTINDCANAILAVGASPIMSNSKFEVEDVVAFSNSLLLNIGTLNSNQVDSMILAGKKAKNLNIPIIFDPVGIGATKYRYNTSMLILEKVKPDIIRGNFSEIKCLLERDKDQGHGVDVSLEDEIDENKLKNATNIIKLVSKKLNSIIVATGKIDIICYNDIVYYVFNGNEELCNITGSGCMLTSLIAAYSGLFKGDDKINLLKSSLIGTLIMGIAGEKAAKETLSYTEQKKSYIKIGTFHSYLFDIFHTISDKNILDEGKLYGY